MVRDSMRLKSGLLRMPFSEPARAHILGSIRDYGSSLECRCSHVTVEVDAVSANDDGAGWRSVLLFDCILGSSA